MDSLDFYELIMDIEKKYTIKISEERVEKFNTVACLIDYVCDHCAG
jgi:acyl carrier protein